MLPKTRARRAPAPTTLREVASSFVGRELDVAALAARLQEGRLVTVTGPGGMGKTRLVTRFAAEQGDAYRRRGGIGGVWFCDLSEARGAAELITSVASSLGVKLIGLGSDAAGSEAVARALAQRGRALVVLDNFEQLTDHAAATVGLWVRSAPGVSFLVTSRVPLGLTGEQLWSLSPLSHPEAVELFARRARDVQPAFDVTRERETVGKIVDAIDRMPLAIELAATRMAMLSTKQLLERLERPLDILGGRGARGRHASMRGAVLDSVDALGPVPRRLFLACAVFRNGFTLEAVESVLGDVALPRAEIVDGLETLVRSSLVRVGVEGGDEVARYAFFETIRDVAEELPVEGASRESLLERHATYYAGLSDRLRARPGGSGAVDRSRLVRDLENVLLAQRTALRVARRDRDPERARQVTVIALGLEPELSARGLSRLRGELLADALDALDAVGSTDDAIRAELLLGRGFARRELGDSDVAREDFDRGLGLARRTGEVGLAAVALTRLGDMRDLVGDTVGARAHFDEALALLRQAPANDVRALREAEAYLRVGHALRREGTLREARSALELAAERYRALEHEEGLASAIYELAVIEVLRESHAEAFAHFEEGFRVAERGGVRVITGALKTARGCLLQDLGRLDEALEHHAEAARVFDEVGSRYREASALYYLATTYFERGEPAEAAAILPRARERLLGVGSPRYDALTKGCLAVALASLGRRAAAEEAMAEAEAASALVPNEAALASNVRIHRLAVELCANGGADSAAVIAAATKLVASASSDDSRFALRALVVVAKGDRSPHDALVVGREGAYFCLPGSTERVSLPERSPRRRILEHLARRRIEAPGEVVTLEEVIGAGWPGESIHPIAAQNRAYVALAALRKQGLRGLLVQSAGGYLLSQARVVRFEIKGD